MSRDWCGDDWQSDGFRDVSVLSVLGSGMVLYECGRLN